MPSTLLLESLPLEVLHHVLLNLTASELASVRAVSIRLRDIATSNIHWRRALLSDLVPKCAALDDIASIPACAWSFSLVEDGWFRAYCALQSAIRVPWLRGEDDLIGGPWMVYFKHHLGSIDLATIEEPHALITFTAERMAVLITGVPLQPRGWWLDSNDGVVRMRVTAYPPNEPGREPRTLCRKFEHSTVLMISDAPEFAEALFTFNNTVLQEAVKAHLIDASELDIRQNKLQEAKAALPTEFDARVERLRRVLGLEMQTPSEEEVGVYDDILDGWWEEGRWWWWG
ncbi:hypothetical protein FN846DRAFT_937894 [Sphaerosporella brunnea]|uniref:F-box domain-containing protein n=1 Tax=Sphaerosporella brunnea TaxID=1250544 RepID=A0A5J5F3W1_9PEZI|nr:hypothetical protein FN846DRAFT_937894 [Sphaerosporella brunnea]